ncbi:MAG: 50S ribosomal protein L3 [Elusimicrobia bacterium]|nr:50S ribosomal protein L3 [Elusimicrobiota bacterium]
MSEEKEQETAQGTTLQPEKAPPALRAVIGEKIGMTQVFTQSGEAKAVTVVKAGPCPIVRVKSVDARDGYSAVMLGYGERRAKSVSKPDNGQFKAAGIAPLKFLREIRVADSKPFKVGQIVDLAGRFAPGDYVDIQGVSRGKGFAGAMKRHGFHGMPASHGSSDKERSPGSLAARRSLGRVLKGQRMAGHLGHETVTTQKVEVVSVDEKNNLLYLNGPVPGPNGGLVTVRETVKTLKRRRTVVKAAVKRDKMGNIIVEKKPTKKKV